MWGIYDHYLHFSYETEPQRSELAFPVLPSFILIVMEHYFNPGLTAEDALKYWTVSGAKTTHAEHVAPPKKTDQVSLCCIDGYTSLLNLGITDEERGSWVSDVSS